MQFLQRHRREVSGRELLGPGRSRGVLSKDLELACLRIVHSLFELAFEKDTTVGALE